MDILKRLKIEIDVNSKDMDKQLEHAHNKLANMSQTLQGVGREMMLAGGAMVGAVGLIANAGMKWQAEVQGVEFMYKKLDKTIQASIAAQAKQAEALGLTEFQWKKNATEIATYLKNAGFASKEIGTLSNKMVTLAADLGAIKDIPVDEVMRDIKSAMVGNFEAVDKYGINLSVAMIQETKFVKQLGKKWDALTMTQKAQAIYNTLTEQGAFASGLAAQEAGQASIQFQLLSQKFKEAAGELGSSLIPVLTPLFQKLNNVLAVVAAWIKENPKLTKWILLLTAGLGGLLVVVGMFISSIGSILGLVAAWTTLSLTLGGVMSGLVLPILGVIAAIAALTAGIIYLWKTNQNFRYLVQDAWAGIQVAIRGVVWYVENNLIPTWRAVYDIVIKVSNAIEALMSAGSKAGNWLASKFGEAGHTTSADYQTGTMGGHAPTSMGGFYNKNAKGGIFTGNSRMGNQMFGEAGHEAVVPLTPKGISTFMEGITGSKNGSQPINVVINYQGLGKPSREDIDYLAEAITTASNKKSGTNSYW